MAQANDPRAVLLSQYFANEFGFYFERQIAGNIIYRRLTQSNVVQRIVTKFPIISGNPWLNQQMREDASALFRLWGSEHNLRILSIVRNKVYAAYREPTNRPLSNPIITPWWLHIDPQVYGVTADFTFFVTEYLPRGTGPKEAAQYNLSAVGNLMHMLATLEVPDPDDVVFPPVNNIQNSLGLRNFKTQASQEFIESQTYSEAFRSLVCMCMADDETEVPGLRGVLFECQRHVNAIGDWTILENEISQLFDNI
ncbi:hypothetical protein F5Y08DRAFT_347781 [Xylaria arbuscula]|nr:hypothetical protein F5Y08DRAFT_347781 [Xylaria arbuscula]